MSPQCANASARMASGARSRVAVAGTRSNGASRGRMMVRTQRSIDGGE